MDPLAVSALIAAIGVVASAAAAASSPPPHKLELSLRTTTVSMIDRHVAWMQSRAVTL